MKSTASYRHLSAAEWDERIARADTIASSCRLCPHRCGVNRHKGEKGWCRAPAEMVISSIFPHHGEEPPVSGTRGSGTIFFSHCTLRCIFCQNYQISHEGDGDRFRPAQVAERMMELQRSGCHNVNLVTPTHFLPWILRAVREAADMGLEIPIVYNCGGYELEESLGLLHGIVDIFLPDMKYGEDAAGHALCGVRDYVKVNREAIRCMFRQVGPLKLDGQRIGVRGLLIRHLVLPNNFVFSEKIAEFLGATFDPDDITISLMAQYQPLYRASSLPAINRRITEDEYGRAKAAFVTRGFPGFYQEYERLDNTFRIDFRKRKSEPLTGED